LARDCISEAALRVTSGDGKSSRVRAKTPAGLVRPGFALRSTLPWAAALALCTGSALARAAEPVAPWAAAAPADTASAPADTARARADTTGARADTAAIAPVPAPAPKPAAAARTPAPPAPETKRDPKGDVGFGIFFGSGSYDNDPFNDDLEAIGYSRIESGLEYGLMLDYRVSQRFSIGAELSHIGADSSPPSATSGPTATYGVSAAPFIVNFTFHALKAGVMELEPFGGVGPLLGTTVRAAADGFEIEAQKTGFYAHAGVTAEARVSTMFSFWLRGFVRRASASKVDLRTSTGDPDAVWDVDFNGTGFSFGAKIYFGKTEPGGPSDEY